MGKNPKNMYKTIRHGENSLQYTILPQNDDFHLNGKIKSVESTKKPFIKRSQSVKALSSSTRQRRSFFAYLGIIFVCTVIMGAIIIPFLISAECMPNPKEWFLRTKLAILDSITAGHDVALLNDHSQTTNISDATLMLNRDNLTMGNNDLNVGKMVKIIHEDGVEKIILKLNKTKTAYDFSNKSTMKNQTENHNNNGELLKPELTITVQALNVNNNNNNHNNNNNNLLEQQSTNNNSDATLNELQNSKYDIMSDEAGTVTLRTINVINNKQFIYADHLEQIEKSISSSISIPTTPNTIFAMKNNRKAQIPLLKGRSDNGVGGAVSDNRGIFNNHHNYDNRINGYKKPAIPPVLVKNYSKAILLNSNAQSTNVLNSNAALQDNANHNGNRYHNNHANNTLNTTKNTNTNANTNTNKNTNMDWIQSHWPYIDPSTYFQWNGFKAEDNVLFPALLGIASIGIIFIAIICLVARNKRSIINTVQTRNRNTMAESGCEDNATLLTGATISDEEE